MKGGGFDLGVDQRRQAWIVYTLLQQILPDAKGKIRPSGLGVHQTHIIAGFLMRGVAFQCGGQSRFRRG